MALGRYRHFWSSKVEGAPVLSTGGSDLGTPPAPTADDPSPSVPLNQTITDVDITGVLKSYSPPRFVREVRQVETGKHMNERILGRLDPEATNFSIVLPSDFESMYAYNQDYQFEIIEELHSNAAGVGIRYATDLVTGTLFDREWADFMQNAQDRDITLRFILKEYTRTLSDTIGGSGNVIKVLEITAGLDTSAGEFKTYARSGDAQDADADLVDMFEPNRGIIMPQQQAPQTGTGNNQ